MSRRRDICDTMVSRRTASDPKSLYEPNNSEHCPLNVHVVVIFRARREPDNRRRANLFSQNRTPS